MRFLLFRRIECEGESKMVKTTKQILSYPVYDSLLSIEEKETLIDIFERNVPYQIVSDETGLKWLQSGDFELPLWKLKHYYKLPAPEHIQQIPDTEFIKINGKDIRINAKYQKARFVAGYWLERPVQLGLSYAKILFEGNPMNINHYPRSIGLSVDVQTENMLIECTNPKRTTWMENKIMDEKIEYFHKADPEHKKTWFLIASFTNWSKKIKKRFSTLKITVLAIGARLHSRNWKRKG